MIAKETILQLAELTKLEFSEDEIKTLEKELLEQAKQLNNDEILLLAWEMSSMLRIDGVRFLPSSKNAKTLDELYKKTRTDCFDFETKKKILLGMFVCVEDNYENYFKKAWESSDKTILGFSSLRDDEVKPSLNRKEIMNNAPNTNGEYFVVPQVVE